MWNNIFQPLEIQDIVYIEARLASVRKNPSKSMITSRLHYKKARLITRNLEIDSQLESKLTTRTRSQFRIPDKLIIVHNLDSKSQILENLL